MLTRGLAITSLPHTLAVAVVLNLVLLDSAAAEGSSPRESLPEEVKEMVSNIHWLGHDGFRLEADSVVVYIDPWQVEDGPQADLVLITHDHSDHCSPEDVARLRKKDTVVVTIGAAAGQLPAPVQVVKPGEKLMEKGIRIEAVPAYNVSKFRSPGVPFHPREAGHVGYVITMGGQRIYHTGDTDLIPEMESLEVDIALLPVSGTYVMTADEAVEAAAIIGPQVAIPMHVGRGIGSLDNAEYFREKSSVPVQVLPME